LEAAVESLVAELCPQAKTKTVPLGQISRLHAARDIYAPIDVPGFNRSAMDGYALRAGETAQATREAPAVFKVLARIMAGDLYSPQGDSAAAGHAVRIMTGAAVPDGFDAVVKQEDTDCGKDRVAVYAGVKPFANYSKIGEDIAKGRLVVKKGERLAAVHAGVLASLGIGAVEVFQPIKAAVISCGSELAELGGALQAGQIYDSNRYLLAARLGELNAEVVLSERTPDEAGEICAAIDRAAGGDADVLITTGGVSVGDKDLVPSIMEELGARRLFWRVNMRPGTPALASVYRGKPVLSLSGNPFAALATFELLFRPMLSRFLHTDFYTCKRGEAVLADGLKKTSKQRRFVRAHCQGGLVRLPPEGHSSSVLSTMQDCNCFIDIKAGSPAIEKGERVDVVMLGGL